MPNQQRISDVLQGNQITDLRKQKLAHLSSGEKQKIAMSAVQVHDPDIYVLDEPSANLDDASCLILARALNALKQQGKTILIADHRIYYLLDIVDRIIYMDNGAIANQWIQREFKQLDPDYLSLIGIRSSAAITLRMLRRRHRSRKIVGTNAANQMYCNCIILLSVMACEKSRCCKESISRLRKVKWSF